MATATRVSTAFVEGFCSLFDSYGWEISETTGTEPSLRQPGFRYFCAGPLEHGGAVQVNFAIGPDGSVTSDAAFDMISRGAKGAL